MCADANFVISITTCLWHWHWIPNVKNTLFYNRIIELQSDHNFKEEGVDPLEEIDPYPDDEEVKEVKFYIYFLFPLFFITNLRLIHWPILSEESPLLVLRRALLHIWEQLFWDEIIVIPPNQDAWSRKPRNKDALSKSPIFLLQSLCVG